MHPMTFFGYVAATNQDFGDEMRTTAIPESMSEVISNMSEFKPG